MLVTTIFTALLAGFVSSSALPTQVHIALAGSDENGNPNAMAVSWQTQENTVTSQVQYGLVSGKYDQTATGISSSCKLFFSIPLSLILNRLRDLPPPCCLGCSPTRNHLLLHCGRF
jgi:hypothetical protein